MFGQRYIWKPIWLKILLLSIFLTEKPNSTYTDVYELKRAEISIKFCKLYIEPTTP